MNFNRRKAVTLFALTLVIVSLLFANLNFPLSASESSEPIYLHGPPLTPVHMHSNESLVPVHMNSNMTLTPVHMHFVGPWWVEDPIYMPLDTEWHELYPEFCQYWNLTSWIDYNGDGLLSPNDQIDMTDEAGNVTWYHVDRITWTLNLTDEFGEERMFVEFKGPPEAADPINSPVCTYWHEVHPSYCNVYHIVGASGPLEYCTWINLELIVDGMPTGIITTWHVEEAVRDLILREKIMDPICTWWHEIYPDYCKWWHLSSWEDNGDEMLSPSDQIDMTDEAGNVTWYHVDRVTLTLNVTLEWEPTEWMKIELKTFYFEEMYNALKHPVDTLWHEVYPDYSNLYILTWWDWLYDDNCNGVLDVCDYIWLYNNQTGEEYRYHVEDICYDIILNKKIMDPICTYWYEVARAPYSLEPPFQLHHLTSWEEPFEDPYPGRLSPGDQIDMTNIEDKRWYHVDRVTLTLNITTWWNETYLFEFKGPFEDLYLVKIKPVCTLWHMVWPYYDIEGYGYHIDEWKDNCNGVLDHCDDIMLAGEWCHVNGLYIDLILNEKIIDPVCTYWHELYPEFCNEYHVVGWTDNGDNLLSPCDWVDLALLPTGPTEEYHVENVTLTLNVTIVESPDVFYYFEYVGPFEDMYRVKTHPVCTDWMMIGGEHGMILHLQNWTDNCNGVLDYCDLINLGGTWCHIEEVAIDMTVKKYIHDVAVTAVASLYPWVYQGQVDPISVTITNLGDYDEPTVDVFAFYDGNLAAPKQTTNLNKGQTKTLTFMWDTTGVPPGFYTVSANATIPIDDVPGNNYLVGNVQEVREPAPPPPLAEDLELYPRRVEYLGDPVCTQWHELHPNKTHFFHLSAWEPGMVLGSCDQIGMERVEPPGPVEWFDVDELTIDIVVRDEFGELHWLDYKCGYWIFIDDVRENPVCTKWNEIKPDNWLCWHITDWLDNGDGKLSFCDEIMITPMHPYPGPPVLAHVEEVTVTLMLESLTSPGMRYYLEFMGTLEEFHTMDFIHMPVCTLWHEILPLQGQIWHLTAWEETFMFSPSDQIVLTLKDEDHVPIPGTEVEYHIDKLTVAMNLTSLMDEREHIVKFEGSLKEFIKYYWGEPYTTQWHEVNPDYCRQWHVLDWLDNGDGLLGYCDLLLMIDKETGGIEDFHVKSLSTDIIVTAKVHDVAVIDVKPSKTIVGKQEACLVGKVSIDVTVENQGYFTETFNVRAYYDSNQIDLPQAVTLNPGEDKTLTFLWNITDVAYGNYTISATADTVPGETDTLDNSLTDDWVYITIAGDVNADCVCDMADISMMIDAFMTTPGDPKWDPNCDVNCDNVVDMADISIAIDNFMKTC